MEWSVIISFALALLAITDPIGNLPFFVSYVGQEKPAVQRWLALFLAMTVLVGLMVLFFTGRYILMFFGISMSAFQIGGGILLLLIAVDMVRGENFQHVNTEAVNTEHTTFSHARQRFRKLLIPLGVPLFVGPGTISTVILYADRANSMWEMMQLSTVIIFVAVVTFVCLWLGGSLRKIIGDTGLDMSTRLLGLLLTAIAVQFILAGLSTATSGLIKADPPSDEQSLVAPDESPAHAVAPWSYSR